MKKSVYIANDIEDKIKKEKNISKVVNEALRLYYNSVDLTQCKTISNDESYQRVIIPMHKGIIKLLKRLKANFNLQSTIIFVNYCIIREIALQRCRKKMPCSFIGVGLAQVEKLVISTVKRIL